MFTSAPKTKKVTIAQYERLYFFAYLYVYIGRLVAGLYFLAESSHNRIYSASTRYMFV